MLTQEICRDLRFTFLFLCPPKSSHSPIPHKEVLILALPFHIVLPKQKTMQWSSQCSCRASSVMSDGWRSTTFHSTLLNNTTTFPAGILTPTVSDEEQDELALLEAPTYLIYTLTLILAVPAVIGNTVSHRCLNTITYHYFLSSIPPCVTIFGPIPRDQDSWFCQNKWFFWSDLWTDFCW